MIYRILSGPPDETFEAIIADKLEKAASRSFKINERLSTTHYDTQRNLLIYSFCFDKKANGRDSMKGRNDFVEELTPMEKELVKCRNTGNVTVGQRDLIERSGITLEDARTIAAFYLSHKKLPTTQQNSKGMKRHLKTIVNNLADQADIAREWKKRTNPKPPEIPVPDWDWKAVRNEYARREAGWNDKPWTELTSQQKLNILRVKP